MVVNELKSIIDQFMIDYDEALSISPKARIGVSITSKLEEDKDKHFSKINYTNNQTCKEFDYELNDNRIVIFADDSEIDIRYPQKYILLKTEDNKHIQRLVITFKYFICELINLYFDDEV